MQEMIDWEDRTDIIGFEEWEKTKETKKKAKEYTDELEEVSVKDWITLVLFLNNNKMQKTKLFKELFLIGERLGLNDFPLFNWTPYHYGPYSVVVEDKLEELKEKKIITTYMQDTSKLYILQQDQESQETWKTLPEPIKKIVENVIKEFENKTVKEIKDYIYAAYPRYAVNMK